MNLRKFEIIYTQGSVPVYHELLVHIDDKCEDDWLTDSSKTVKGLDSIYLFVVDKIVHDMSKRAEIYVSTDTLYNILDRFRENSWECNEKVYKAPMSTFGELTMERQYFPFLVMCNHCNGTAYSRGDVTQGKCFHCNGSGTKKHSWDK